MRGCFLIIWPGSRRFRLILGWNIRLCAACIRLLNTLKVGSGLGSGVFHIHSSVTQEFEMRYGHTPRRRFLPFLLLSDAFQRIDSGPIQIQPKIVRI